MTPSNAHEAKTDDRSGKMAINTTRKIAEESKCALVSTGDVKGVAK